MTEIITAIQKALATVTTGKGLNASLVDAMHHSDFICQPDYPVALLHTKARIDTSEDAAAFEDAQLLDETGSTPAHPSALQFDAIVHINPKYLQQVSMMVLSHAPSKPSLFDVKRQNDYWKKIQEVRHIKAMVDISEFRQAADVCDVEFALREIIRKRKEVHALKEVGFIWIAVTLNDFSEVFRHYFHDNYLYVTAKNQGFHIGWSPTLRAISMRSFVCPPK